MTGIISVLIRHYRLTIFLFILPALLILAQNIGYQELATIPSNELNEISGMVYGRRNPEVLWVHNDSGDKSNLYAINLDGSLAGRFRLAGVQNRDWEDIAAGPGPEAGVNYLYIGDIGDNDAIYREKIVYRVPEPLLMNDDKCIDTVLTDFSAIRFVYPDGARDAECLIVDPLNGDMYVLSKRDPRTHIYFQPYPQPVDSTFKIQSLGTIPVTGLTAGDISADGKYILLKNYSEVYLWERRGNEPLRETLSRTPEQLPYIPEPQGEAIAWDPFGRGYTTTSEVVGGLPARLTHYEFHPPQ